MVIVPLSQGYVMWASDEDAEIAWAHKWTAFKSKSGVVYAFRNVVRDGRKRPVVFHREILNAAQGEEIDHINGVNPPGLKVVDNRRDNLRKCTHRQNTCGHRVLHRKGKTSRFRGVSRHKAARKWEACIMVHYKKIGLGFFDIEEDAAEAYDKAAHIHFGEFADPNFKQAA